MKKIKTFLTDEDGLSAKDAMMLSFGGVYLAEQIVAFILSLLHKLNDGSLAVIQSLDTIVLTIVCGVFGVHAVNAFRKKETEPDYEYSGDVEEDDSIEERK